MGKLSGLVYDYGDLQVSFGETAQGVQLIFLTANGVSLHGLRWELVEDLAPFLAEALERRASHTALAAAGAKTVIRGPWGEIKAGHGPDKPTPPEAA